VRADHALGGRRGRARGTGGGCRGESVDAGAGHVLGRTIWKDRRSVWARVGREPAAAGEDCRRDQGRRGRVLCEADVAGRVDSENAAVVGAVADRC
jgi:hypothetical protein